MPPTKTIGIVLKTIPYRESSSILHLYTKEMGLVQGVAKGVRRKGKDPTIIERGFLVETLVYGRGAQTLHTLGALGMIDYFPGIRSDLAKSAMRDTMLETLAAGLHESEANEALFVFLSGFLGHLDVAAVIDCFPFALWRFYTDFASIEGFGLNLDTCLVCKERLAGGGRLKTDMGGLVCTRCEPPKGVAAFLPGAVIDFLGCQSEVPAQALQRFQKPELKRITRLLASYCRYHFDHRFDCRSLEFVDEMIDGIPRSATSK
jgi:DNA repair protein RecO (recombination protein O)